MLAKQEVRRAVLEATKLSGMPASTASLIEDGLTIKLAIWHKSIMTLLVEAEFKHSDAVDVVEFQATGCGGVTPHSLVAVHRDPAGQYLSHTHRFDTYDDHLSTVWEFAVLFADELIAAYRDI